MTVELPEKHILSISQLNRQARILLETHMAMIWVRGEISNFARPGSGHWYFSLKDDNAQIRCAMFRNRNQLTKVMPKNGEQVLVRGRISLYEARGEYQLIVEHLEGDGAGLLQQRFEALKEKLRLEGLFDESLKCPLPRFPRRIGVITSPTGAAVRDILHVSARRHPWIDMLIYPAAVQGKEAIKEITQAIALANRHQAVDLLILARGGGSIEDLWAFNEEMVARAIRNSSIPTISAVGHETDFTIADFVADLRAPTPSAAAEIAGPDRETLLSGLQRMENSLSRQVQNILAGYSQRVTSLKKRLRSPADKLREQNQHLDHLEIRLINAWHRTFSLKQSRVKTLGIHLNAALQRTSLNQHQQKQIELTKQLIRAMALTLDNTRHRLQRLTSTLNAVSPLATLERGYAIARNKQQQPIISVGNIKKGQSIEVLLKDGEVDCLVEEIHKNSDEQQRG